jgi:hypothetical protein
MRKSGPFYVLGLAINLIGIAVSSVPVIIAGLLIGGAGFIVEYVTRQ